MKKILTAMALVIGLSTTANAKDLGLEAINWKFIPEDYNSMQLTQLHITLKNTGEGTVRAYTGEIECVSLLDEVVKTKVRANSVRIDDTYVAKYQGSSINFGEPTIWDFVQTGNAEDFTCKFTADKVVR